MKSQFVVQENSRRNQSRLVPLAAETVLKSTYMDDSIDSIADEEIGNRALLSIERNVGSSQYESEKVGVQFTESP